MKSIRKTPRKRSLRSKKTGLVSGRHVSLVERKDISQDLVSGELSKEDFDMLGPINVANDLGDDEQLKYWSELGENRPGSEMEDTEKHIDETAKIE